jgi:hypothetical protein
VIRIRPSSAASSNEVGEADLMILRGPIHLGREAVGQPEEANRLQAGNSFRDTARVLRIRRSQQTLLPLKGPAGGPFFPPETFSGSSCAPLGRRALRGLAPLDRRLINLLRLPQKCRFQQPALAWPRSATSRPSMSPPGSRRRRAASRCRPSNGWPQSASPDRLARGRPSRAGESGLLRAPPATHRDARQSGRIPTPIGNHSGRPASPTISRTAARWKKLP